MQPVTREEIVFMQKWLRRIADNILQDPPCKAYSTEYQPYLHETGYGWFSNAAGAMEWALDLPKYGGPGERDKKPDEEIDNAGFYVDTTKEVAGE
jgi:hypothetical protein